MRSRRSGEHGDHGRTRGTVVSAPRGAPWRAPGAGSRTLLAGGGHRPPRRAVAGTARRPSKGGDAMAWVVKRWRTEGLERLLSEDAVAAAHTARAAPQRDGRHARRAADRAPPDPAAPPGAL